MAYSVTFEPGPGLRLLRSPLVSVVRESTDATRNDPTFQYFCRVQVWGGAPTPLPSAGDFIIATLKKTPDTSGYGVFDISPLLDTIISQSGAADTDTNDNVRLRNVRLRYGYFLDGVESLEVTSDYFQISDGFAVQQEAINEYSESTAVIAGQRFLTPQTRMSVVRDQDAWIHIYLNEDDDRDVQYRLPNGTQPFTVPPDVGTRVWRLPLGVDAVNAISDNPSFTADNGYLIQLIDGTTTAQYQQIRVDVLDASFCDVPTDTIAYINRFGVWDYIHVRGQQFDTISQNRSEWSRRIANVNPSGEYDYTAGTSEIGVTEVIGTKTIVYNTGYVLASTINEKITDLLLSRNFFSIGLNQPINLDTQSIQLRNDSETELINYELRFKVAGNLIQNIL